MYCPKCCKTIPDEKLDELGTKLVEQFGNDALTKGKCPVCGTRLLDTKRKAN
jgi:hypothetical protein